jgi:hypothetical protein
MPINPAVQVDDRRMLAVVDVVIDDAFPEFSSELPDTRRQSVRTLDLPVIPELEQVVRTA